MPTCRRKRVLLTEPSEALLHALKSDPNRPVFYLERTGEIFENYDAYAARMSFYRLKQFQCEVTGKSGLDYFQALESEQQEARTLHSRFPEPLKSAILKAVQWQVMGRLDHLVEAVFDRYKDRYFAGEKIYVDIQGDKFLARIVEVFPPRSTSTPSPTKAESEDHPVASSSSAVIKSAPLPVHAIGGDLKVPAKEVNAADDPRKYYYRVQILEEERPEGRDKLAASVKEARAKYSGSFMEVQCPVMSRDRLSFSKSILRRFIRDCVDRDAAVASPWTVKPQVAKRYGVDTVMPEETRLGVEDIKKGEIQKRKKVWEDKEGPSTKKHKKLTAAQEEKAKAMAAVAERKEREAREKAEKQQKAKEEAERLAAEKKKKKPIRYPTEDLDVVLTEKEKKAGMKVKRPVPSRVALPFNDDKGTFEKFLMAWNFLVVYGHPLHLSTFTLDEFEHAIRHSLLEPECQILAEVHSTLIYNLRTLNFNRHSAVLSLLNLKDADADVDAGEEWGVSVDTLLEAMADVGNNWERAPLRHNEGREGWQESLVGCLKDHATVENFPALRRVLTHLLFAPIPSAEPINTPSSSRTSSPSPTRSIVRSVTVQHPAQRYHALPPEDRIAILYFMCNIAVSSKAIHVYMESCEEQLTALRKEKIEVNRTRKQYIEERDALLGDSKEDKGTPNGTPNRNGNGRGTTSASANGTEEDTPMNDLSDLSDVSASEGGSESGLSGSGNGKPTKSSRDLRRKAQTQAHAKEREAARMRNASAKQALAEHRRLDEEVNKLERRLEGIEREFRKLLGSVRVKPMGRDRFYNRVWWFDGMGSASLLGSGGIVQYGTGRIFLQGPSVFDQEILDRREDGDVHARRLQEEGEEGMLGVGEWAVFTDLEEMDEFTAWLNPKGNREIALRNALTKWWPHIAPGIRKRQADLNVTAKLPEARRSARVKHAAADISRDPYMMWTNRRAVNNS